MSLDVSLMGQPETVKCVCAKCDHEHTRIVRNCFFDSNITHNLTRMASEAGIYKACWRPEEIGITTAAQLVPLLKVGLALLKSDRERFDKFNAENGWGTYNQFVPWVEEYLAACKTNSEAAVEVSR